MTNKYNAREKRVRRKAKEIRKRNRLKAQKKS